MGYSMDKNKLTVLLLILAAGFILRLNNVSERSLWTDEFFTLFQSTGHGTELNSLIDYVSSEGSPALLKAQRIKDLLKIEAKKNLKDVSEGLLNTDTHPPLYFWIMHIWMKSFGDSVFVLRFFSLLTGLFGIFLAYQVGKLLFNENAGIFSALFAAVSPFSVRFSQEARAYSFVMALGLLSSIYLLRFEKNGRNKDSFLFVFFSALGYYAHYFYSFISIGQFVYFTLAHANHTQKIRRFYLVFLCSLLFFVPWFLAVLAKGYNFRNVEWVFGYPGIGSKLYNIFCGIAGYAVSFGKDGIFKPLFLLAGAAFFVFTVYYVIKEGRNKYPAQSFFCLVLFIVPLSGMLFVDILQHGALLKQERFWMFSFLGFIPLAGYSLNCSYARNKIAAVIFVAVMLISSITSAATQFGPSPKDASVWINKESSGLPCAVIVFNIRSAVAPQAYYLDDNTYLAPVSGKEQLFGAVGLLSNYVDRIFIARHFHRTDASLMDQPFMGVEELNAGFRRKASFYKDDVSVTEYIKCGS